VRRSGLVAVVLFGAGLVLSACVERVETREVVVAHPPPAARVEAIPAAPGPAEAWVWQGGHWRWDGREYVWQPGRYVERPHRAAEWVPAHYQERAGGWVYVPGHWR